jgi:predicted nuclease of predicted toxin-antitoxin system
MGPRADPCRARRCARPRAQDAACTRPTEEIFDRAGQDDRVVLSADTDFPTLLAMSKQTSPSVVLFRRGSQHRSADQAALLKANLPQLAAAPKARSIVVIEPNRIRIRALPLIP